MDWESMKQLTILKMQGNNFSGSIPNHLRYLERIQLLDLSRNKLSKGIPTCFKNFSVLSEKRVSGNHILSDEYFTYFLEDNYYTLYITWKHFQTFDESSFEGNIDLCGEQVNKKCLFIYNIDHFRNYFTLILTFYSILLNS